MADKNSSDVPPIPIPPIVDLAGTGNEPSEKTEVRPRKKAEPKVVPPAVPPASVTPVEATPEAPAPSAAQPDPYAQPNPYAAAPAQPNPYAAAPAAQPDPYAAAPGGQPNPYGAASAPQPYSYGPYVPQPPKGLSIASMALGIGGVVFCGTLFLVSLAAVILGHMAVKRQPYAKGFWLTGIISGYAGIALGLIWGAVTVLPWLFYAISGSSYGY